MNPFIQLCANGQIFFAGMLLSTAGLGILFYAKHENKIARMILRLLVILGFVFVIISATPLPFWAYLIWCTVFIAAAALISKAAKEMRSTTL